MPPPAAILDVVVVGAGAAGLFAAHAAAAAGCRVLVLEKNRKIGVKILISGGSRCNLTHDCSFREVATAFGNAERFLLSALGQLTPQMVVELIERLGVSTYVEAHTGKVFPVSDRALDVRDALHRRAVEAGAEFLCHCPLRELRKSDGLFQLVTDRQTFSARTVILTSGGLSYPGCGTTGDGYPWARHFGHRIVTPHPALTPLVSQAAWVHQLSGIALEDTLVTALGPQEAPLGSARTATLFTHFGLSGPAPMDVSRFVTLPGPGQATDGRSLGICPQAVCRGDWSNRSSPRTVRRRSVAWPKSPSRNGNVPAGQSSNAASKSPVPAAMKRPRSLRAGLS